MLLVPALILALRMAKIHAGLVINGILFARLMQEQNFTRPGDPERAGRHNFFGVSFLQFVLASLIAGFSATLLALTLNVRLAPAIGAGAAAFVLWVAWYFHFHHQAVKIAHHRIAADTCESVDREQWAEHVSRSLEDANFSLIAEIGFVGLMVFSLFEKLSGLGEIKNNRVDLASVKQIQDYGPMVLSILMLVTCLIELLVYLRTRVAIGHFSLQLDPTDKPFRPLRLTDSLLGYMILAFLFAVSLHMVLTIFLPDAADKQTLILGIDVVAFGLAVLTEQLTLVVAGRSVAPAPVPAATKVL
jgi:hypothetical protein